MTSVPNLNDLGLPGAVGRFSQEPAGLIVFAGGKGSGYRESAYALAEHVASTTGRAVVAISSSPMPSGISVRHRTASGYHATAHAIREEAACTGWPVILADATLDTDTLGEMVKAAAAGIPVIATMESERESPYAHLVDLIWAAEDWGGGFRRDFDDALYAVVTQTTPAADSGQAPEIDLYLGNKLR